MKKHRGKLLATVAIGAALIVGQVVYAAIEPGTAEDPLVTLSLVDQKFEQLKYYIDQSLAALPQSGGETTASTLEVVELNAGETLIGNEGTEIILRSGNAVAISSELGGLADLTGAKDLVNGNAIPANHLLLVPRGDGRGIRAEGNCFVMVRGGYTITK